MGDRPAGLRVPTARPDAGPFDAPPVEALAARRLLRRLRRSADLTQEQLAERCGISDRAVRGLESGAVRAPHPATLERLADALGLTGADQVSFLALWRDQSTRLSVEGLLESLRGTAAELMGALGRQPGLAQDVTLFERLTMGDNRDLRSNTFYRSIRVLAPIDRWLFVKAFDPSAARPPTVVAADNCRGSASWSLAADIQLYELSFDRQLQPGEMYTFGFTLDFAPGRTGPDGITLRSETENVLGVQVLGPSLHLQVEFQPAALPDRVWQFEQPWVDGPGRRGHELTLSPFHIADVVLEHPRPALHGITWQWHDR